MDLKRTTASFQPQARLVSILGEQMISDSVVGLIELVKNAYDADASQVQVTLEGLEKTETTCITVEDDGFGMSAEDVLERFLSPAINHKAQAKGRQERTPKYHRLPIGEKGVGRFAAQQLGRQFILITRASGQPEVVTEILWDSFDRPDIRLSDVHFDVVQRDPEVFTDDRTGTRLVILRARDQWDQARVVKLQRGLRRLRSPHIEDGKTDFDVVFSCLEFADLQSLDQGDLRERYHYLFRALVESDGTLHYEYQARHPGASHRDRSSDESGKNLVPDAREELSGPSPACGPFYLNLYVWDRSANYLAANGISRRELDAVAGVSLFRDRLRVLPYGDPGDDWLFLDRDRINNPSERIGNNQVVGYVEISQEATSGLRDKTNREGLIDNSASRDLRALVRSSIRFFETLWREDRPITPSATARPKPAAASRNLQDARVVATALGASARNDISVTVPAGGSDEGNVLTTDQTSLYDAPPLVITQRQAADRVVGQIDTALSAQRQIERRQREERDLLLHLAATGQAAERVVHEFGRQVTAVLQALDRLRAGTAGDATAIKILESALGALRNEFRLLSPGSGVTRFQKRRPVYLMEAARVALELNRQILDERKLSVSLTGDDFSVFARPSTVVQILDNIIHNAAHWAEAQTSLEEAAVVVLLDARNKTVLIQDNGPGINFERQDAIFEPMVTTRPEGHGLGLYIVRELLNSDGGKISLLSQPGSGARFLIDFSAYPAGSKEENE